MTDRTALRRLAQAATPGPWEVNEALPYAVHPAIGECFGRTNKTAAKNAEYIAAANPAVVIDLLDTIERLEKNQRRTGTVEVCESCGELFLDGPCTRPPRDYTGEKWNHPCPIIRPPEPGSA